MLPELQLLTHGLIKYLEQAVNTRGLGGDNQFWRDMSFSILRKSEETILVFCCAPRTQTELLSLPTRFRYDDLNAFTQATVVAMLSNIFSTEINTISAYAGKISASAQATKDKLSEGQVEEKMKVDILLS